jgi:hypothetical protein
MVWVKDKDITDRFGVQYPLEWLNGEPIISSSVVFSEGSDITSVDDTPDGNTFTTLLSGGVVGFHKATITTATPTRQREDCITVWIKDC